MKIGLPELVGIPLSKPASDYAIKGLGHATQASNGTRADASRAAPGPGVPISLTAAGALELIRGKIAGGTSWVAMNGQTFRDGPYRMSYDETNGIIYSANWNAGVWALKVDDR